MQQLIWFLKMDVIDYIKKSSHQFQTREKLHSVWTCRRQTVSKSFSHAGEMQMEHLSLQNFMNLLELHDAPERNTTLSPGVCDGVCLAEGTSGGSVPIHVQVHRPTRIYFYLLWFSGGFCLTCLQVDYHKLLMAPCRNPPLPFPAQSGLPGLFLPPAWNIRVAVELERGQVESGRWTKAALSFN